MRKGQPAPPSTNVAGINKHAKAKTDGSLKKLDDAMAMLRSKVESGLLDSEFNERAQKCVPTPKEICVIAGLGEYFLYGKSHKGTTDVVVNAFREDLIKTLKERQDRKTARNYAKVDSDALREAEKRYKRLSDHAHIWFRRMRDMSRELRRLKRVSPPTLVSENFSETPAAPSKKSNRPRLPTQKVVQLHPKKND